MKEDKSKLPIISKNKNILTLKTQLYIMRNLIFIEIMY